MRDRSFNLKHEQTTAESTLAVSSPKDRGNGLPTKLERQRQFGEFAWELKAVKWARNLVFDEEFHLSSTKR